MNLKGENRLKALENYIELYTPHVSRLCFFLCGNRHLANDIFQETWIKVIRNLEQFDETRDFGKWVSAICTNTYKNMHLKAKRENSIIFSDNAAMEAFWDLIPASSPGTAADEYEALYDAIDVLTPKQREVIVLHYFSGYSETECAEILGIPQNSVKSRMYSARQALKRRLNT